MPIAVNKHPGIIPKKIALINPGMTRLEILQRNLNPKRMCNAKTDLGIMSPRVELN